VGIMSGSTLAGGSPTLHDERFELPSHAVHEPGMREGPTGNNEGPTGNKKPPGDVYPMEVPVQLAKEKPAE
jgi:hypothetical protein